MKAVTIAFVCAVFCSAPAWSQDHKDSPEQGKKETAVGKLPNTDRTKKDNGGEIKLRVAFDKDTAKGEITCRNGKLTGNSIEYEKCLKLNVDKYEEIAILKKILVIGKLQPSGENDKPGARKLGAKLAFLDAAKKELDKGLEKIADKKDTLDYKKALGACKKISRELNAGIAECSKDKSGALNCPEKVAEPE